MKRFFLACALALAAVPAYADTVMSIVSSSPTEWVGQGQSKTYTNANATFTIGGDKTRLTLRVAGADGKNWELRLRAPVGTRFRPHEYWFAEREGAATGRSPGMEFSGDGRACGDVYGDFSIRQIGYDANGRVNMLEASVLQRCDSDGGAPLAMVVMYRAPRLSFSINAVAGDWVGMGLKTTLYNDTSVFFVSPYGASGINYRVEGMGLDFSFLLVPPYGQTRFNKGTYDTYRFQTGLIAGMDMSGNGRGDNTSYGRLEVLTIAYDAFGALTQLSARYTFYTDDTRTTVVRSGGINYVK